MKKIYKLVPVVAMALALSFTSTSCVGDLDVTPIDPNLSLDLDPDGLFNLTTDEAMCCWLDNEGIPGFNTNDYSASNPMIKGFYARLTTGIAYCNQYISVAGDKDKQKTAEIRFLRAFYYSLLTDAFGNIPFTTTPMTKPERYTRAQAYEFIVNELKEIEPDLAEAKPKLSTDANYGRVDKAADWLLLSRLYLNAKVYTGKEEWQNASLYAKKVMDSSYELNTEGKNGWSAYQMLFMGDNGETNAAKEAILPLLQDGLTTTSWGTTLFLSAGCFSTDMHANPNNPNDVNGVASQAWGGNRARPDLLAKFFPNGNAPEIESYNMTVKAQDDRALFWGKNKQLNIDTISVFRNGYAVAKFTNFKTDGSAGHDATFMDTDFFILRKAEAYLTYAEANARLNGGTTTKEGTDAIDAIRKRAHAYTKAAYTLSDICDEWSREFYFEGRRRMDLIRFGRYGGNNGYKWQWKGGVKQGRDFDETRNLFPLPADDVMANDNLKQNDGY